MMDWVVGFCCGSVETNLVGSLRAVIIVLRGMHSRRRGLIMLTVRYLGKAGRCLPNGHNISNHGLIFPLHKILNQFRSLFSRGVLLRTNRSLISQRTGSQYKGVVACTTDLFSIVAVIDGPPPPTDLIEWAVSNALVATLQPGLLGPNEVDEVDARHEVLVSGHILVVR